MPTLDTKGPFMGDMEKQQENANCDFSSEYGLFLGEKSQLAFSCCFSISPMNGPLVSKVGIRDCIWVEWTWINAN
jgi:hypothetical protein